MISKNSLKQIKLSLAPTRRNIFSATTAIEFTNKTRKKLDELGVNYVDIKSVNDDGLFYDNDGLEKITEKFKDAKIDGLFIANENFGTEYEVARLAAKLNVPVLLWEPRDEAPAPDDSRRRDTQCGLFTISKVSRHFSVPLTYIRNSDIDDPSFGRGAIDFIRVRNIVKTFKNTRILQIGTRPFDFWSIIVNEGELLERLGIQLSPISLGGLTSYMNKLINEEDSRIEETKEVYRKWTDIKIKDEDFTKVAALRLAMQDKTNECGCNADTIQCWTELQHEIGILPYASETLLQTEGMLVICETDINDAISEILAKSATLGDERALFADVNYRHPENENDELFQHLGTFAFQTAKNRSILPPSHFVFDYPGSAAFEVKDGAHTLIRFDGGHGKHSMLTGNAKTCDGSYEQGTCAWFEFKDLNRFEAKYVHGPYIHHAAGVRADVVPILAETCKYINVKPDYYDPIKNKVAAYWYGDLDIILDDDQET